MKNKFSSEPPSGWPNPEEIESQWDIDWLFKDTDAHKRKPTKRRECTAIKGGHTKASKKNRKRKNR